MHDLSVSGEAIKDLHIFSGCISISPRVIGTFSDIANLKSRLKDVVILRIFTNIREGDTSLTDGANLVKRYMATFRGDTTTAMECLFSKEEQESIKKTVKLYRKISMASEIVKYWKLKDLNFNK